MLRLCSFSNRQVLASSGRPRRRRRNAAVPLPLAVFHSSRRLSYHGNACSRQQRQAGNDAHVGK